MYDGVFGVIVFVICVWFGLIVVSGFNCFGFFFYLNCIKFLLFEILVLVICYIMLLFDLVEYFCGENFLLLIVGIFNEFKYVLNF